MGPMGPSGPMGPVGQPGGSGPPVCISYQHRLLIVIFISLIRNICVPHSMLFSVLNVYLLLYDCHKNERLSQL